VAEDLEVRLAVAEDLVAASVVADFLVVALEEVGNSIFMKNH
jgi:hypothetical protein